MKDIFMINVRVYMDSMNSSKFSDLGRNGTVSINST